MLPLRGQKIDPTLENKLRWIILLEVVGSTKYSNPTTSRYMYEDKNLAYLDLLKQVSTRTRLNTQSISRKIELSWPIGPG